MDSLMAALVAALLIRASDPSIGLVAAMGERSQRTAATLGAVWLAVAVTQGVAAAAGILVSSHLSPNAARLLFAMALIAAGATAFSKPKPIAVGSIRYPLLATVGRLVASGLGDRCSFATFAIAAGGVPALAGVGGAIGSGVVLSAAAIAGTALVDQAPRRAIAIALGAVLVIAGAWIGLSALRLI
jgi:putative Ca2+/H+ antiporter (TMEM165/GDT1 family)